LQRAGQVGAESRGRSERGVGLGAHDHASARCQAREQGTDEGTQTTLGPVPYDGSADGLGYDEPDGDGFLRQVLPGKPRKDMDDDRPAAGASAAPDRGAEVGASPHPVRR
jgi:hypothetical protein